MSTDRTELEEQIISCVDAYGCFVMGVFDPDDEIPNFAYSIGFPKSLGQGDILISGLSQDLMKRLVNDTYGLCRDGFKLEVFARTNELLSSFDCVARQIAVEHLHGEHMTSAVWFSEQVCGSEFTSAYQLVWPDKSGLFPWEDGFSESLAGAQLELWNRNLN